MLADGRGVTRAHLHSFYEAAASYFRKAPWRRLPGEMLIEIGCSDPDLGTRYGMVIGMGDEQYGLCVFDDRDSAQALMTGFATMDECRALLVSYDTAEIVAAVDLQWVERLGWPIAAANAWPVAMRLAPRRTPRAPTSEEILFLDACLCALPEFVASNHAEHIVRVETRTRPVELYLAWE